MLSRRSLLLFPLLLATLLLSSREVNACSCVQKATVLTEFERAHFAVVVQVMSVEKTDASQRNVNDILSARAIVERVFKGAIKPGEEMIVAQGGGCNWIVFGEEDVGQRFLFYLSGRPKGETIWQVLVCGRSTRLEDAADDLQYLENEPKVRGKTRLSGTLEFYQPPVIEGEDSVSKVLAGQRVRIVGNKKSYDVITNSAGVYEIYDLPAGSYTVQPEIPDGWRIDDPRQGADETSSNLRDSDTRKPGFSVALEAQKHAFLDFKYGVKNVIRGQLFDSSGNGMVGVCLDVLPAQGKASEYFYKSDCTGNGSFEIDGIPPGSYIIVVNKRGKISSSSPFKTFYYPKVFEREKAVPITIVAGQTIEGINIQVPALEETITVEGIAYYSDGKPVIDGRVNFEAEKTNDGVDGDSTSETDSSGRFALKIIKGLKGTLYSEMYVYPGKFENCPKIEELLKHNERGSMLQTNMIDIQGDAKVSAAVLRYPFPECRKREPF